MITRLRSATGAEIAVVTLPTIGDYDEADVALAIGRKWGVGARADIGDQRRNAGIVLLLVPRINHQPGTGHVRIEVGQGLEGIVTDAASGDIRRDVMGPLLAQEDYAAALTSGVKALTGRIARGYGVTDSTLAFAPPPRAQGRVPTSLLVQLPPILLFIGFMLLANRGGRRRRVYWGGGPWIGGGGAVAAGLAGEALVAVVSAGSVAVVDSAAAARGGDSDARIGRSRRRPVSGGRRCRTGQRIQRVALRFGGAGRLYRRPVQHQPHAGARRSRRPARAAALAPAFTAWRKATPEPPLVISRAEWARAVDVFPIEITDMRAGYQVLRGPTR